MEVRHDVTETFTLDARQRVDWIDEVLHQVQEFYMRTGRQPDQIEVTQEQADDLRAKLKKFTPRALEPNRLWGVPVVVRER